MNLKNLSLRARRSRRSFMQSRTCVAIFILILLAQALSAAQQGGTTINLYFGPPGQASIPSQVINVGGGNLSNTSEVTSKTDMQLDTKIHTDQKTDQKTDQDAPHTSTQQQLSHQNNRATGSPSEKTSSYFGKFGFKHALGLAAGTIACAYLTRTVIIYQTTLVLKKKRSWCNWKYELSFEQLINSDQKNFSRELLTAIQERHFNTHNPSDHVYPVTQFLDSVQHEANVLNRYLQLVKWEQKLQLYRLFSQKDLSSAVMQRLNKLSYLKSLFFDWAREHRTTRSLQTTA